MAFNQVEVAWIKDGHMVRNMAYKKKGISNLFGNNFDTYISLASYGDLSNYIKENGSVKGYPLPVWYPYITFDIANVDIDALRNFLVSLETNWEIEDYRLYFSGAKGFHVQIPSAYFGLEPSPDLHRIIKGIARCLAEGIIDYDTTIYDKTRIFRLPNTMNSKSGLYKILIHPLDLDKGIEHIRAMAQNTADLPEPSDVVSMPHLVDIVQSIEREMSDSSSTSNAPALDTSETITVPYNKKACIYTLLNGVGEGNRDAVGLRIADYFKKEGLSEDLVHGMLTSWNERNNPPLPANDIDRIVKQAMNNPYDFGCNDPILKNICTENCFLYKSKSSGTLFKGITQIETDYRNMVQLRKDAKILTGIDEIDAATRGLAPQLVMTIVARSASFKSAVLQNILMHYSYKKPALWFSQEMPTSLVFERLVQIEKGVKGVDVEEHYLSNSDSIIDTKKYSNFFVDDASGLSADDIEKRIIQFKEEVDPELYLVGIDYLQMMGGYGNLFEKVENASRELKEVAKRQNVAIVILSQSSREAGKDGKTELGLSSGKGGGAIEEAADFLINLWKSSMDERKIYAKISKNRLGASDLTFLINIDPETLRIDNYSEQVEPEEEELPW